MSKILAANFGYLNIAAADASRDTLLRGFTTVRDAGANSFGVKNAIDAGLAEGPRIYPSGPYIGQTSGHGDFRGPNDVPENPATPLDYVQRIGHALIADGAPDVIKRSREILRMGASQIKAMAGGGVSSLYDPLDVTEHTFEEAKAVCDVAKTSIANRNVRTSFIDRMPYIHQHHRLLLPFMPFAVERFNLREYETIFSFSYAVAHGVQKFNGARHIAYTFTPMRYAWLDLNIDGTHQPGNRAMNLFMKAFRRWDKSAASYVHQFIAVSQAVAGRIVTAYGRTAEVIYPPVEVDRFKPGQKRDNFYITVTRLVPHKRVDILVQAFSQLNLPLLVVGDGPKLPHLARIAGPNIKFLGYQPDERVVELLGKARGFVCATEEDFGIAIVEAQAAGCPVIGCLSMKRCSRAASTSCWSMTTRLSRSRAPRG